MISFISFSGLLAVTLQYYIRIGIAVTLQYYIRIGIAAYLILLHFALLHFTDAFFTN